MSFFIFYGGCCCQIKNFKKMFACGSHVFFIKSHSEVWAGMAKELPDFKLWAMCVNAEKSYLMNNNDRLPLNAVIVEDEVDLCFLLSMVLKQKNLNPSCAYTLADAKKTIKRVNPSVLFLDNCLPDGYGIDFITEVKDSSPQTKIVMITAHTSADDKDKAIENGADYFISKPFTPEVIKNTIDLLLQ